MKTPESLETLVDYGIIQEVIRPLMSGKEAQVFVVMAGGAECVAKVYKEATERTFKHRVQYTEGRKTRNTRDQRAINKRTRHGKKQDEAAWRNAEVDTLYRVRAGGVRVPEPINFVDGVLVMELVRDADGDAAPRLGDLEFPPDQAYEIYKSLIREVVRMLCAGTIHGDLSEFNVLMAADGPVVIDFPQSVDPSKNPSARGLLLRDVANLHRFLARHAPEQPIKPLGEEMWARYEKNRLRPDTELVGDYVAPSGKTDVSEVLALIDDANQDERMRREARGDDSPLSPSTPLRRVVDFTQDARSRPHSNSRSKPESSSGARAPSSGREPRTASPDRRRDSANGRGGRSAPSRGKPIEDPASPASRDAAESTRPRRRRRRRSNRNDAPSSSGASTDPAPGPRLDADPTKPHPPDRDAEKTPSKRRRRRRASSKRPQPRDARGAPTSDSRPPSGPREPGRAGSAPRETAGTGGARTNTRSNTRSRPRARTGPESKAKQRTDSDAGSTERPDSKEPGSRPARRRRRRARAPESS